MSIEKNVEIIETLENFDQPKGLTVQEQIDKAILELTKKLNLKNAKTKMNTIKLGVEIQSLETREGSEMKDKKTGVPIVDENGEVKRFSPKYFVTLVFKGSSLTQEVKHEIYRELKQNVEYLATGYLGTVTSFGKTEIAPIFTDFEELI